MRLEKLLYLVLANQPPLAPAHLGGRTSRCLREEPRKCLADAGIGPNGARYRATVVADHDGSAIQLGDSVSSQAIGDCHGFCQVALEVCSGGQSVCARKATASLLEYVGELLSIEPLLQFCQEPQDENLVCTGRGVFATCSGFVDDGRFPGCAGLEGLATPDQALGFQLLELHVDRISCDGKAFTQLHDRLGFALQSAQDVVLRGHKGGWVARQWGRIIART